MTGDPHLLWAHRLCSEREHVGGYITNYADCTSELKPCLFYVLQNSATEDII
jgi:hypothetical protein